MVLPVLPAGVHNLSIQKIEDEDNKKIKEKGTVTINQNVKVIKGRRKQTV